MSVCDLIMNRYSFVGANIYYPIWVNVILPKKLKELIRDAPSKYPDGFLCIVGTPDPEKFHPSEIIQKYNHHVCRPLAMPGDSELWEGLSEYVRDELDRHRSIRPFIFLYHQTHNWYAHQSWQKEIKEHIGDLAKDASVVIISPQFDETKCGGIHTSNYTCYLRPRCNNYPKALILDEILQEKLFSAKERGELALLFRKLGEKGKISEFFTSLEKCIKELLWDGIKTDPAYDKSPVIAFGVLLGFLRTNIPGFENFNNIRHTETAAQCLDFILSEPLLTRKDKTVSVGELSAKILTDFTLYRLLKDYFLPSIPTSTVSLYLELHPNGGEVGPIDIALPYPDADLKAVLAALQWEHKVVERFPKYVQPLTDLKLMRGSNLVAGFNAKVGQALFDILFSKREAFAKLEKAMESKPAALQLRFDENAVAIARYPWELLYYGKTSLGMQGGGLQITRYITCHNSPSPLKVKPPLRILFISPRPSDQDELPNVEVPALIQMLVAQPFRCERLEPPTWAALRDKLSEARKNKEPYHILHFDGHGNVNVVCPNCKKPCGPAQKYCEICKCDLTWAATPTGDLYFEKADGKTDAVSADRFCQLLASDDPALSPRLVVLSACRSGEVKGESVFNSLAPALIQAGVPAVIAMQGMVEVAMAKKFMEAMYRELAHTGNIPYAVNEARWTISDDKFFIPVVYLRSTDDGHGQLFETASRSVQVEKTLQVRFTHKELNDD